jgi:hypothetical protein
MQGLAEIQQNKGTPTGCKCRSILKDRELYRLFCNWYTEHAGGKGQ